MTNEQGEKDAKNYMADNRPSIKFKIDLNE